MQRFTELRVWQRAHATVLETYRATRSFPDEERYGLTAQTRRAAVSVSANIAEGAKRNSRREYARFLNMAEGSASEAQALLLIARDLAFLQRGSPSTGFGGTRGDAICAAIDRRTATAARPRPPGRSAAGRRSTVNRQLLTNPTDNHRPSSLTVIVNSAKNRSDRGRPSDV